MMLPIYSLLVLLSCKFLGIQAELEETMEFDPHFARSPRLLTELEDHYETEIDPREPRSFIQYQTKVLSVRQLNFHEMTRSFPDGHTERVAVNNWEVFAMRYWYETRTINCSCSQEPFGIAAYADWALNVPCLFGNVSMPPRIIYVHNHMLSHFVESTLRFMDPSYRFVLVTGGTDITVPRQTDSRYRYSFRGFGGQDGGKFWSILVNDGKLIHWFAENHDLSHPKVSTLPTGMSLGVPDVDTHTFSDLSNITILPLAERPYLQVLMSDRVRNGRGQWALRAETRQLCSQSPTVCYGPPDSNNGEGMPRTEYLMLLVQRPFVACVRGGGLDPSPKAWEAIIAGTVPIIQSNWLDDAYRRLPLVIVSDWREAINGTANETAAMVQDRLRLWAEELQPFYEHNSHLRNLTLKRLSSAYWMGLIQAKIDDYDRNYTYPHPNRVPAFAASESEDGLDDDLAVFFGLPQYDHITAARRNNKNNKHGGAHNNHGGHHSNGSSSSNNKGQRLRRHP